MLALRDEHGIRYPMQIQTKQQPTKTRIANAAWPARIRYSPLSSIPVFEPVADASASDGSH
jgi:hypothetical protein